MNQVLKGVFISIGFTILEIFLFFDLTIGDSGGYIGGPSRLSPRTHLTVMGDGILIGLVVALFVYLVVRTFLKHKKAEGIALLVTPILLYIVVFLFLGVFVK